MIVIIALPKTVHNSVRQPNTVVKITTVIVYSIMTQISTSVQQTTKVAVLMPSAVTMWAASYVPVYRDTPVMDSPAQVNKYQKTRTEF